MFYLQPQLCIRSIRLLTTSNGYPVKPVSADVQYIDRGRGGRCLHTRVLPEAAGGEGAEFTVTSVRAISAA